MIRFNQFILMITLSLLLVVLSANLLFNHTVNDTGKHHIVEINRAFDDILKNGFSNDVSTFTYIQNITYLPFHANDDERTGFFDGENDSCLIRTIDHDDLSGYLKFTYLSNINGERRRIRFLLNICLILMSLIILAILLYLKINILQPFHAISEMPYALSKGHLVKNLGENKNRFFGKFLWGLDMLRETLEGHKRKELALAKEKKTLILSISHDIKTPLSAIKLYTRALLSNLHEEEEKRLTILQNIDKNTDEIESFVRDIITASKEDFLTIEVKNGEFYLEELIESVKRYYDDKTRFLHCDFQVQPYQNHLIYGDKERSLEVLENIMENAIKYGDGKSITIHFNYEEDCLLLTVSNTGSTMPENEIIHMFDSFFRGSNAKDKAGNGLGLYICRQITSRMKGDVFAGMEGDVMRITVVFQMV